MRKLRGSGAPVNCLGYEIGATNNTGVVSMRKRVSNFDPVVNNITIDEAGVVRCDLPEIIQIRSRFYPKVSLCGKRQGIPGLNFSNYEF